MLFNGLFIVASAIISQPDPNTVDLERLQGTWLPTECIRRGKELSEERLKGTSLVFKNKTYHHGDVSPCPVFQEFGISASTNPKEIDFTANSFFQRSISRGIYELNQDRLVLYFKLEVSWRPASSRRDNYDIKWTFERQK